MSIEKTVLIVEDDAGLGELLSAIVVEDIGANVVVVCDGETALNQAASLHPDLIVLDILIPRVNGVEVCRRLKADPMTRGIPILAMSASERQRPEGCDAFLRKPFELDDIVSRIGSLLRPISSKGSTASRHIFNWSSSLEEWNAQLIQYMTKRHSASAVLRHRIQLLRISYRRFLAQVRPTLAPHTI